MARKEHMRALSTSWLGAHRRRVLSAGLVLLAALATSERTARSQAPPGIGIDPLEVLNLQVKPNVLIVFDTSGSMSFPLAPPSPPNSLSDGAFAFMAGDDSVSRMSQAKQVLRTFLQNNRSKANFGLASYFLQNSDKVVSRAAGPSSFGFGDTVGGPIRYVSNDPNASFWTGGGTFFGPFGSNPVLNTGTTAANIYSTFARIPDVFDGPGCTPGTPCRRYLRSSYLRTRVRYQWTNSTTFTAAPAALGTCPKPPASLFPTDPDLNLDGLSDYERPCVQMTTSGGTTTTFWYTGTILAQRVDTVTNCSGAAVLSNVSACTADNVDNITNVFLKPELPLDGSCPGTPVGVPCGLNPYLISGTTAPTAATNPDQVNPGGASANTLEGLIPGGGTPIGTSLRDINTNRATIFPSNAPGQKNYVLFVTDGDDSCTSVADANTRATTLFNNGIETLVFGFSNDVTNVNSIARAGSGNVRDAFLATDSAALTSALEAALSELVTISGQFAAAQTVTETIFEYAALVTGSSPLDPATRYNAFVPTTLQPVFDMPGFKGALRAFQNDNNTTPVWDAATKLLARVNLTGCVSGGSTCTFRELIGNGSATDANIGSSSAKIKRRIYTTSSNGVNPTRVTLWPPTVNTAGSPIGVAPGADQAITSANSPNGLLDKALGIDTLTYTQLQSQFQACVGSNLPSECANNAAGTLVARREAREMILAYLAGAQFVPNSQGKPTRTGNLAGTVNDRKLIFQARTSVLAEASLGSPALVPPPLDSKPTLHINEYTQFRDGPRNASGVAANGIDSGFGLRNPDKESPQTTASKNDNALKPRMTVAYYPSNDGVHAFRAGPCPSGTCTDTGGEELWSFVPFDQLGKLPILMLPTNQARATHQYMIATSVRFTDVFVPGSFSQSIGGVTLSGTGKWRTVMIFGRGLGGKFLTAIDVTIPGPFTRGALDSAINPPIVLWNRGNPDTNDGLPFPTGSNVRNNTFNAASDYAAYLKMGQTWSTPAVTRVDPTVNLTPRNPSAGVEYAAFVGSGYGSVASEGTTFYSLDALTGDVIRNVDIGDRTSGAIFPDNAIVASPSAFIPSQLVSGFVGNASAGIPTFIYVGDIHGRLWRFAPEFASGATCGTGCTLFGDFGANQPIARGVALININTDGTTAKPHIYGETGDDVRVTPAGVTAPLQTTPPFKLFGLRDDALTSDPSGSDGVNGPVTVLFLTNLPNSPAPGYRGTAQPAAVFNTQGNGRVFFVVTQFTPPAGSASGCISDFKSLVYAVTAATGTAAYSFGVKPYTGRLGGVSIVSSPTEGARVLIDSGTPAAPPAPPAVGNQSTSGPGALSNVYVQAVQNGSPVCRQ